MNGINNAQTFNQTPGPDLLHCLWMDAGVVDYKLCDRDFDCDHCPFDEVLHGKPTNRVALSPDRQNEFNVSIAVEDCELPGDLFFHPGHIWLRIEEGGVVRIGLDDFGQRLFGPAYSLLLPEPHAQIKRGDACCRFTHQSGVATLFSPVSGKVKTTNANLLLRPSVINRDPYGEGWMMLVEPADLKTCLKRCLYGRKVRPWLTQEIEKLRLIINSVLSDGQTPPHTMMDGGLLTREFLHGLSVEQTRRVISSFFPLSAESETEPKSAILVSKRR